MNITFMGKALVGLVAAGLAKITRPIQKVPQSSEDVEALQRAEAKRARRRAKLAGAR